MSLFLPITKVDAAQRLVYGTISEEVPDKTGEILDYASSRPAFEEWSRQFHEASGGKSLGNVRAMHGAVAAGKLTDIFYDDANRRIDGVAKIVDEDEWRKVEEGVYTGFSIGGGYARRWPDESTPGLMRYTPVLMEVSLVDNPAVPTATFEFVRMDGQVELRKLGSGSNAPASAAKTSQLLAGLDWLAAHAGNIGAAGLLAHIDAIREFLQETDESDDMDADDSAAKMMKAQTSALQDHIEALRKRIAELEAEPMPPKGALRAIGKNAERFDAGRFGEKEIALEKLTPADRARELMKLALANPIAL